jgi:hypothetical protein
MYAVCDGTRKSQHQRRCTTKCQKNPSGNAEHRPLTRDIR